MTRACHGPWSWDQVILLVDITASVGCNRGSYCIPLQIRKLKPGCRLLWNPLSVFPQSFDSLGRQLKSFLTRMRILWSGMFITYLFICIFFNVHNHRTDEGQASLMKAFESASGRDRDRCAVAKDLNIKSMASL
jgi:hypothetical protein